MKSVEDIRAEVAAQHAREDAENPPLTDMSPAEKTLWDAAFSVALRRGVMNRYAARSADAAIRERRVRNIQTED